MPAEEKTTSSRRPAVSTDFRKEDQFIPLYRPRRLGYTTTTKSRVAFLFVCFSFLSAATKTVFCMRIVVQRVKSASVTVEGNKVSSIGPGILGLVGLHEHDTEDDVQFCCKRILGAKLWGNDDGRPWRHGVKQKGYDLLMVSQFTLYGTLSKKNQPDYKLAMKSVPAEALYARFLATLRESYQDDKIHDGIFGAMMDVELVNDGPVTIVIESEPKEKDVVVDLPST